MASDVRPRPTSRESNATETVESESSASEPVARILLALVVIGDLLARMDHFDWIERPGEELRPAIRERSRQPS